MALNNKHSQAASDSLAAIIVDMGTAALISAKGNLSWLCWPDFDCEACFAGLLGTEANGIWSLAPKSSQSNERHYVPGTLVLETTYKQLLGASITVTDFMPKRDEHPCVMRIVRGIKGRVDMTTSLAPRFDYGAAHPRLEQTEQTAGMR